MHQRPVEPVAGDFDLTETAVREWVSQTERDAGERSDGLTSFEREELRRQSRQYSGAYRSLGLPPDPADAVEAEVGVDTRWISTLSNSSCTAALTAVGP